MLEGQGWFIINNKTNKENKLRLVEETKNTRKQNNSVTKGKTFNTSQWLRIPLH